MTPEAAVKKKVHTALKRCEAYAVNYIGGMYASSGTPDILACLKRRFIGIEVKAKSNMPTALQIRALRLIDEAGGLALVINETNLDYLNECLDDIENARSNYQLFAREAKDTDA